MSFRIKFIRKISYFNTIIFSIIKRMFAVTLHITNSLGIQIEMCTPHFPLLNHKNNELIAEMNF